MSPETIPGWKDRILFTPGPLTTSRTVKQAMLRDVGSRDTEFINIVADIRRRLVECAGATTQDYTTIPIQGSGTFGVEGVISSVVPPDGKLLLVANGAYGKRLVQIARVHRIAHNVIEVPENQSPDPSSVESALLEDPSITTLAMVHCETTTGMINPVEAVGSISQKHGKRMIVDAMSSFGAVPLNVPAAGIDYIVSSANKCIEGVPGFSFAVCRKSSLEETPGWARTLSLDLYAQWQGLEKTGQFRFTPATHSMLAFHQALLELEMEGGVPARAERYRRNHAVLLMGMIQLGFKPYLPPHQQGHIITSFRSPSHPRYDFEIFYRSLQDRGYVIYPGKVSDADCFRIGHIGRIFESDTRDLLAAIRDVMAEMKMTLVPPASENND
ncbi:2-aminoethylphosphonate--pyruvate transaminase [bacterium]|nr:2-aminoethylphosphonate--pyruvate transaminase [bacterium]